MALSELGWLALSEGDYLTARARLEESLGLRQEMGYQVGVAIALNLLGDVALRQGDYPQAKALIEKGLRLRQEMGNKSGIAWSLQNLGYLAQRQGEPRQAAALLEQSLSLFRELGNKMGIAECLEGLAGVAAGDQSRGKAAAGAVRAVRLLAAADSLRSAVSTPLPPYRRADYDRDLYAARAQLGDAGFAAAWEAGRAMSGEQAVAYALGEGNG
jgi:tetratricopeptide (TPR) repeat protein